MQEKSLAQECDSMDLKEEKKVFVLYRVVANYKIFQWNTRMHFEIFLYDEKDRKEDFYGVYIWTDRNVILCWDVIDLEGTSGCLSEESCRVVQHR